jgi:UDP-GlcNAc3NAcA epimerase
MKLATVIGARPQFIKAAAVSREINNHNLRNDKRHVAEVLVHTGQHYDHNMSQVFFDELEIRAPHYNLGVGSGKHGEMTGKMLARIEEVLLEEKPDLALVYGDTNSTLAGALAAAKLHIPVAHVEAGLRSYNKKMPEEINRLLTDHVSSLLFAPTEAAMTNLQKEGISYGVVKSGDVMYDAFLFYQKLSFKRSKLLSELDLQPKSYFLATIHRQENTDDRERLTNIFKAFNAIGEEKCPLVIPLHPRTRNFLNRFKIDFISNAHIRAIEPIGYLDMIQLESNARIIFTDSGGVQKEAYFAGVPCVTLRDETEWVETVQSGVNFIAGADMNATVEAYKKALSIDVKLKNGIYGDGHAAEKIVESLVAHVQH